MNKLRQGLVVSTIATLSLFAQVNKAIASVLNKDKTNHNTEDLVKITDNTASAISINFDNNANITPPDSTQIKAFFMEWNILTNDEKSEFNRLWNKATQSDLRHIYEKHIIRHFTWKYDDEGKLAFIVLTLGWEETILRPKCKAIIDWNPYYLYLYPKIKENIQWDISIYLLKEEGKKLDEEIERAKEEGKKLDEEIERAKEEGKKLDEEGEKLDEEIKKLKAKIKKAKEEGKQLKKEWEQLEALKKTLEAMKKAFEENQEQK